MSWIEQIETQMEITTGDGKKYTPNWVNAVVEQDFNLSEYNYPEVTGTFVNRRKAMGKKHSLTIFFQGEDHLDIAKAFMISAENQKAWKITHPYHGELRVQPSKIRLDNKKHNISMFSISIRETIKRDGTKYTISPVDSIKSNKIKLDAFLTDTYFEAANPTPDGGDITKSLEVVADIEAAGESAIIEEHEKVSFKNKIIEAQSKLLELISEPTKAMEALQAAINFPFQVISPVDFRISAAIEAFDRILVTFETLTDFDHADKVNSIMQLTPVATAAAIAAISSLEEYPYESREEVDNTTARLVAINNAYVDHLNSIETETQTDINSFAVDPDIARGVQDIFSETISHLIEISLDSMQEFIVRNDADSNAIILTHKYYGMDSEDVNFNKFVNSNNIGLNEVLLIRKDRELKYYR